MTLSGMPMIVLRGFNTCTPEREAEVYPMLGCVFLMLLTVKADDNIDQR